MLIYIYHILVWARGEQMSKKTNSYIHEKIIKRSESINRERYSSEFLDDVVSFLVKTDCEHKNIITLAVALNKNKVVQSRNKGRDVLVELINRGYFDTYPQNSITDTNTIIYNPKVIKKGKLVKNENEAYAIFEGDKKGKDIVVSIEKNLEGIYNNLDAYLVHLPSSKEVIVSNNRSFAVSRHRQVTASIEGREDNLVALGSDVALVSGRLGYDEDGFLVLFPYKRSQRPIIVYKVSRDIEDLKALNGQVGIVEVQTKEKDFSSMPMGELIEAHKMDLKKELEYIVNLYTDPYAQFDTDAEVKKIQTDYKELVAKCLQNITPFDDNIWNEPDQNDKVYDFVDFFNHTIDPANAQDLDDSVYAYLDSDGNLVTISHITNIPAFVLKNSNIDQAALDAGETTYFPYSGSKPMIPRELTDDEFSLLEGKKRLVFSLIRKVDFKTGAPIEGYDKVVLGIISSKGKYSYPDVSARLQVLKDSGEYEEIKKKILQAKSAGQKLFPQSKDEAIVLDDISTHSIWKQLKKNGMMNFVSQDEFSFEMDETGKHVISMKPRERYDSCKMIEAYALTGNNVVAEFLIRNNLPGIYRIHDEPDDNRLVQLQEVLDALYNIHLPLDNFSQSVNNILDKFEKHPDIGDISENIIRSLQRAEYSVDQKPHMATGMDAYVHFTSGIRRYADIVDQRIILDFLQGRVCEYTDKELRDIARHINERSEQIDEVHKMLNDLYMADYATNFIGKKVTAKIYEFDDNEVILKTKEGMKLTVPIEDFVNGDKYTFTTYGKVLSAPHMMIKQGDEYDVIVEDVDLASRQVFATREKEDIIMTNQTIVDHVKDIIDHKGQNKKRERRANEKKSREKKREKENKEYDDWE